MEVYVLCQGDCLPQMPKIAAQYDIQLVGQASEVRRLRKYEGGKGHESMRLWKAAYEHDVDFGEPGEGEIYHDGTLIGTYNKMYLLGRWQNERSHYVHVIKLSNYGVCS